jgi:integrase
MPVHKRPDSDYWQIRFTIAHRTVRCSSGVIDRAAAEELEEKLRRRLWRQIKLGEKRFTWDQAVERCRAEDSHQRSWERTERALERLDRFLKGAPLTEITRDNIVKIRTALTRYTYNAGKDRQGEWIKKPLTHATINRDLCALRSILKRCAGDTKDGTNWEMLEACPKVPLFPTRKLTPRFITRDQAHMLLGKFPPHTRGLMIFALATGLRRANVTGMEWSRIDFKRRTAFIPGELVKGERASLAVPLNDDAIAILKEWQGKHERYVFCFRKRAPIKQVTTRMWRRVVKSCGLEGLTFHMMRHSWASWHVQGGTPLKMVQELGGWASLEMPMRYAHLNPGHLTQYANQTLIGEPERTESDTVEPGEKKARLSA